MLSTQVSLPRFFVIKLQSNLQKQYEKVINYIFIIEIDNIYIIYFWQVQVINFAARYGRIFKRNVFEPTKTRCIINHTIYSFYEHVQTCLNLACYVC